MLLGARTAAWSGGDKYHGYVSDGLVRMYDVRWNDGNAHDASCNSWVDLTGNGPSYPVSWNGWEDGLFLRGNGTNFIKLQDESLWNVVSSDSTCEFVIKFDIAESYNYICLMANFQRSPMIYYNASVGFPFSQYLNKLNHSVGDSDTNKFAFSITGSVGGSVNQIVSNGYSLSGSNGVIANDKNIYLFTSPWYGPSKNAVGCIRYYNRILTNEERSQNMALDIAGFNLT